MAAPIKNGNKWYFGYKAGLDFGTLNGDNDPTFVTDGLLIAEEGCTTICDDNGALLLASDGQKLYDGQWNLIASNLGGSPTSTQSGLAIKNPADPTVYYLFCVAPGREINPTSNNLSYNILRNVTTSGLTLDPSEKNLPLYGTFGGTNIIAEKLTAKINADGSIWIISKESKVSSPRFVSFKIGFNGILNPSPVFNNSLLDNGLDNRSSGQMKFSADGKKMAACILGNTGVSSKVELYDFDENTGLISNGLILDVDGCPYGLEFAPNSEVLYVSQTGFTDGLTSLQPPCIYQFNINTPTTASIQATRFLVHQESGSIQRYSAMQLGPNLKIYFAQCQNSSAPPGANYLGVIDFPNVLGAGCGYNELVMLNALPRGIYTVPNSHVEFGLPTFNINSITPPIPPVPPPPPPDPTPPQPAPFPQSPSPLEDICGCVGNICCDNGIPSDLSMKAMDFFYRLNAITITNLLPKVDIGEKFGKKKKVINYYDRINDFTYLFGFLVIIYKERQEDILNSPCNIDKGRDYYIKRNKLKCIRDYFQCLGYNIDELLSIFDLGFASGEGVGINYMTIDPDILAGCPPILPFIVS